MEDTPLGLDDWWSISGSIKTPADVAFSENCLRLVILKKEVPILVIDQNTRLIAKRRTQAEVHKKHGAGQMVGHEIAQAPLLLRKFTPA